VSLLSRWDYLAVDGNSLEATSRFHTCVCVHWPHKISTNSSRPLSSQDSSRLGSLLGHLSLLDRGSHRTCFRNSISRTCILFNNLLGSSNNRTCKPCRTRWEGSISIASSDHKECSVCSDRMDRSRTRWIRWGLLSTTWSSVKVIYKSTTLNSGTRACTFTRTPLNCIFVEDIVVSNHKV
jgi:hypothetical protein